MDGYFALVHCNVTIGIGLKFIKKFSFTRRDLFSLIFLVNHQKKFPYFILISIILIMRNRQIL